MKKIVSVLLTLVVSFALVACGNTQPPKQPQEQTKTQNEEKPKEEKGNSLPELKLNQPFSVKTEHGTYTLTIDGIRTTSKRNQFSEQKVKNVIMLDYTYKNESFGDNQTLLYIDSSAFILMDDEGNVLSTYPVSDENRDPKNVPVGGKCLATQSYALPNDTKNIKVQFVRSTGIVAEGIIKLSNK